MMLHVEKPKTWVRIPPAPFNVKKKEKMKK